MASKTRAFKALLFDMLLDDEQMRLAVAAKEAKLLTDYEFGDRRLPGEIPRWSVG
jgi:hypothetical protein